MRAAVERPPLSFILPAGPCLLSHVYAPYSPLPAYSGMTKIIPGLSFVGSLSVALFASAIFCH